MKKFLSALIITLSVSIPLLYNFGNDIKSSFKNYAYTIERNSDEQDYPSV